MTSESPAPTDASAEPARTPKRKPAKQKKPPKPDQGLRKLLRLLIIIFVIALVAFGAIYYLSQRPAPTANLSDRAVEQAEQLVTQDPQNVGSRLELAAAYLQAKRDDDALAQYQEILKVDQKNRAALIGAGTIQYRKEAYPQAKEYFQAVVKNSGKGEFANADRQLETSQFYLGMINLHLSDVPGAITSLQAALAIDDTDADAWSALGGAQVRAGDYSAAVNSYQQALSFIPSGWCDPYEGLSVAYGHLNKQSGQDYATAMNDICKGDTGKGIPALESLKSGEFAVPAMLGLGIAYETSGDPTKALSYYQQVITKDPKNIVALSAVARLAGNEHAKPSQSNPSPAASTS